MALVTNNYQDGITWTGATSSTPITFTLLGGKYVYFSTAAGTTNVLSLLSPDNSTYIPVSSNTTSAFFVMVDLPPGSYEVVITTSSAVAGGVIKVPYNTSHM